MLVILFLNQIHFSNCHILNKVFVHNQRIHKLVMILYNEDLFMYVNQQD